MNFFAPYRAAIFDLDGTLTDSMHLWDRICRDWLTSLQAASLHKAASQQAAAARGVGPFPDDLEAVLSAMTLPESAAYVIRRFSLPLTTEEISAQWQAMVLGHYRETVPLKPGAAELVRALAGRGLKLAVATSCFPAACEAVLARHGLRDYFAAILYSGEVKRNKAYPDIWLAAAASLETPPEQCVVFEDMYAALAGARAAGMGFVAVCDESCAEWPAMKAEADLAVQTPGEAAAFL